MYLWATSPPPLLETNTQRRAGLRAAVTSTSFQEVQELEREPHNRAGAGTSRRNELRSRSRARDGIFEKNVEFVGFACHGMCRNGNLQQQPDSNSFKQRKKVRLEQKVGCVGV